VGDGGFLATPILKTIGPYRPSACTVLLSCLNQLPSTLDLLAVSLVAVSGWITKVQLRDAVRRRLLGLGFQRNGNGYSLPFGLTKDQVREQHRPSRRAQQVADRRFIKDRGFALLRHFADGREIARLHSARTDRNTRWHRGGRALQLATTMWSSYQEFGRRLRFLKRPPERKADRGVRLAIRFSI
jgi:hypothetical protein